MALLVARLAVILVSNLPIQYISPRMLVLVLRLAVMPVSYRPIYLISHRDTYGIFQKSLVFYRILSSFPITLNSLWKIKLRKHV